jgi:hypothetical protein
MSLLTPWALGLAAAAAIPVLLHLFRRDTRRRMAFPAVRYLRQAHEASARRLEIQDRLLLLARVSLVALIAAAAAGPLIGRGGAADHAPTDVALVIDNSASMSRLGEEETLLELQRARALSLVDAAREGDRFWILPAVGPVVALGVPADEARRALEGVRPTDGLAELADRVREALRILPPASGRPREIVLLSDLQATSTPLSAPRLPPDVRLVASLAGASEDNQAILRLRIDPPTAGSEGAARVGIGPPGAGGDTIDVRLALDGRTVALGRAMPGEEALLRFAAPEPGDHAIEAEIAPSGLRSDDRRSAVYRSHDSPAVRHVGPRDGYLTRALATLAGGGRLRLAGPEEDAIAWVVEGIPPGDPAGAPAVWVLAPPADAGLLGRFNAWLDALGVPWRVDLEGSRGDTGLPPVAGVPGIESVRVFTPYRLRSLGADSAIVRALDGSPFVVTGTLSGSRGNRRYLLVGSPWVESHTDLPVRAAMVPFVEKVLFDWAGLGGMLPEPTEAGSPVTLPAGADSVRSPSGETVRVDGGAPFIPLEAGVYGVFERDGGRSLVAVTVPLAESDLRPLEREAIGPAFGAAEVDLADSESEWTNMMYGSRRGAPVAPWLLALAVAVVCVEGFLATSANRSSAGRVRSAAGRRA